MAQANPENKIRNIETPKNRPPEPGNADALVGLPSKSTHGRKDDRGKERECREVARRRAAERPQQVLIYLFRSLRRHAMNLVVDK